MSESLTDFGTRVARYHRVPTGLVSSGDQTQAIHSAVRTYSTRAPLERSEELSASTTGEWTLTSEVSGWVDGYNVVGLFYRWSNADIPIDANEWRVSRRGSVDYLQASSIPCNTDGIWLEYTRPHVVGATSGDTTLPTQDLDAVAKLAAAECCRQAAAAQSDEKGSTFTANVVDYGAISANWIKRAEELEAAYSKHMDARYPRGSAWAEWDGPAAYGRRGMWHNTSRF